METPRKTPLGDAPAVEGSATPRRLRAVRTPPQVKWSLHQDVVNRWSINHLTCVRAPLDEELADYQQLRLAAIGLNWPKLQRGGLLQAAKQVRESGLRVSSLGWAGGFTGANNYGFDEAIRDARRMVKFSAQVGCANLLVATGPSGNHIRPQRRRLIVDALQALVPSAEDRGVNLCVQPMHRSLSGGWSFLHGLDETLEVLDALSHARVKLAFSAWHLRDEPRLLDRIGEIAGRTSIVSLADWNADCRGAHDRLLPGDGNLPLWEIVDAFEAAGYRGWYEAEVWSRDLWKLSTRDLMRRCVQSRDRIVSRVSVR